MIGNALVIDGGEVVAEYTNGSRKLLLNNHTIIIDVARSWNNASTPPLLSIKKTDAPILNLGALWPAIENQSLFAFGGIPNRIPGFVEADEASSLNKLDVNMSGSSVNGTWSSVPLPAGSTFSTLHRPGGALAAAGGGKAFMLGGFSAMGYDPAYPLPGLLIYDMQSNLWSNDSATGFSTSGTATFGRMEYLGGVGTQGVLVALGGRTADPNLIWKDQNTNLLDLHDIYIYDIAGKTWQSQRAVGATADTVPSACELFCPAVLPGPHATSYEIVLYGGDSGAFVYGVPGYDYEKDSAKNNALNAVHVLSIPGFVWFRANYTSAKARAGHSCNVVGNRQVLSIGGQDSGVAQSRGPGEDDPSFSTFGIFDAVDLRWKEAYDADAAPYQQPDVIQEWYKKGQVYHFRHYMCRHRV